jgi:hypothetical protein
VLALEKRNEKPEFTDLVAKNRKGTDLGDEKTEVLAQEKRSGSAEKPKCTDLGAKKRKGTDLGAEGPKCWR